MKGFTLDFVFCKKEVKMKKVISTLIFCMVAFCSYGQCFLYKYHKLTKKNLEEFFMDWESYSNIIASKAKINDSLIDSIQRNENEYVSMTFQGLTQRYIVLPQRIRIARYYIDVDTIAAKRDLGFPSFIPDLKDNQHTVYSITPIPHQKNNVLYLTSSINKVLSTFAGGLKKGNKIAKINNGNVERLKKYIPVDYGHWGGYWWFTSFPVITGICYANNLIAVMRRTSWFTGDVIWYIKENDKFVRRSTPICEWVE